MHMIREYTLQFQTYHDEIVGRICFNDTQGQLQESALYSLPELQNIVSLWKGDQLLGSFGIGAQLASDAVCYLTQK